MQIWIVDADISFAFDLKKSLKKHSRFQAGAEEPKILVFNDYASFKKKVHESQDSLPCLIFMDADVERLEGLGVYVELCDNPAILDALVFCSAMSFGEFADFFATKNLPLPPFVQKNQIQKKLSEILGARINVADKAAVGFSANGMTPQGRQQLTALKHMIKNLADSLYDQTPFAGENSALQETMKQICKNSENLGMAGVLRRGEKVLALLEQKKQVGNLRLRRELKILLGEAKKLLIIK